MGERSGRILTRDESESDQERVRTRERLARARAWVSRAQRRLGLSTSHPSLPAPSSVSSSHAMQPSSVVWFRFPIIAAGSRFFSCRSGFLRIMGKRERGDYEKRKTDGRNVVV